MSSSSEAKKDQAKVFGSIIYECERCGTRQSLEELSQFPEIRCKNCGFRAFKKVGPTVAKSVKAV